MQPRHSPRYYFVALEVITVRLVLFTVQQILRYESTLKTTKRWNVWIRKNKVAGLKSKMPLEWDKRGINATLLRRMNDILR